MRFIDDSEVVSFLGNPVSLYALLLPLGLYRGESYSVHQIPSTHLNS